MGLRPSPSKAVNPLSFRQGSRNESSGRMMGHWMWWIVAALLIGAELLTGTFYLLAIGIAAALGGVAALLGASEPVQFAVAGVLGIVLTMVAHRWRLARATPPPAPPLDVGQSVRVQRWNA